MIRGALVVAALALAAAGCGETGDPECDGYQFQRGGGGTVHVASCGDAATCGNGMNPPMAGPHCSGVTSCTVHETAVSRCTWLHNLEHGHAVLAYNCPDGCPELVAELQQLYTQQHLPRRVIVTPDPLLPTRFAAIVWGYAYSADTVDRQAVECLLKHQDEEAPEAGLGCAQ